MILVAGLTPAWQQIMCFPHIIPGEVNRARETHWCASGKVLNAGMALASLEADAHTLSPVGGWAGSAIEAEFAARKIPATWIRTSTTTRVCTTLLDDAQGTTELVENAAGLTAQELEEFRTRYAALVTQAKAVVLTGSLPTGTPATFYRECLARTPCPVVLDARGPELLEALVMKPAVVKPNRAELAMTVGRALADRASVLSAMRELIERGARSVLVTQGKDAVWLMDADHLWELTPPPVEHVVNPIGCGDCLAAGIALGLARGETLVDAARLGLACAAENLPQLLPARLSRRRVEALRDRVAVSPLHSPTGERGRR